MQTTYTVFELDTLRTRLREKAGASFEEVACRHDGTVFRAQWHTPLVGTTHFTAQCLPLRAGGWVVTQDMVIDRHSKDGTEHAGRGPRSAPSPTGTVTVPQNLRDLSTRASTDWALAAQGKRIAPGGVVGGPVQEFTNGSAQTQIAAFTVPSIPFDSSDEPADLQRANAEFAVACVAWVRGLLEGDSP
ncbi:MAG TPA: hypothetical protein VFQ88_07825 [Nevskiaceae bacterium]|nr:hypothetical protein [Nevskiaceae bacterium]